MLGRRRLLVWVLGVLGLLATAPATAAAAESTAGISFLEGGEATRTWDDLLGTGSRFLVCNGTTEEIRKPRPFATGFEFTSRGRPVSIPSVLELTSPDVIAPGNCAPLIVASKRGGVEGSSTGDLTLVADGAGLARISVTIDEAQPPLEPAQVGGAGEATLKATSALPFVHSVLSPAKLLLQKPGDDVAPLELGIGCDADAWNEADCPSIGNLYNEAGEIVEVFINGPSVEKKGVVELPIRTTPDHLIGEYSGKLDPGGSGEEDQLVPVKLIGSDGWWCALIAVLLGASLTLFVQYLRDRRRPWERWRIRQAKVTEAYLEDGAPRTVPGHPKVSASKTKVDAYVRAVAAAAQNYAGTVLFIDTGSDAYEKIEESLDVAEEDARTLTDPGGLAAALDSLDQKLAAAKKMLEGFDIVSTPDLIGAAAAPGSKGELGVGEATKRAECAGQLDSALEAWTPLARRVLELEDAAAFLWAHVKSKREPIVSDADLGLLTEASAQHAALREELFHARDLADVERLRTSSRIEAVHGKLISLRSRYEAVPALEIADVLDSLISERNVMPEQLLANLSDRKPGSERVKEWDAWGLVGEAATPAQIPAIRERIRRIDIFVLLVGLATAVVAALLAVFFPADYFGTTEDYLTVIFAGTTSQAFVKLAEDYFSIFSHDLRAEVPPKPPRLELSATSE